jgi:hypothetical protein
VGDPHIDSSFFSSLSFITIFSLPLLRDKFKYAVPFSFLMGTTRNLSLQKILYTAAGGVATLSLATAAGMYVVNTLQQWQKVNQQMTREAETLYVAAMRSVDSNRDGVLQNSEVSELFKRMEISHVPTENEKFQIVPTTAQTMVSSYDGYTKVFLGLKDLRRYIK